LLLLAFSIFAIIAVYVFRDDIWCVSGGLGKDVVVETEYENEDIESNDVKFIPEVDEEKTSIPLPIEIEYTVRSLSRLGAKFIPDMGSENIPMPLLVLFDPSGAALNAVRRWSIVAQEKGWLVASSSMIRNGTPDEQDEVEALALVEYMINAVSLRKTCKNSL